jgi:hypothetical protein
LGWVALLAAALYYHPWMTAALIGVTTPLMCVIVKLRASVPPWQKRT